MKKFIAVSLLLIPTLVQAHPGHSADGGVIAGAAHALSGIDHLTGALVAGLLLGALLYLLRWLVCAAFMTLLGAAHAAWGPPADGAYLGGLLGMTTILIATGMAATRIPRITAVLRR